MRTERNPLCWTQNEGNVPKQPGAGGRGQISRALEVIFKNVAFIFRAVGGYYKVLRESCIYDFHFRMSTQAAVWEMDRGKASLRADGGLGGEDSKSRERTPRGRERNRQI